MQDKYWTKCGQSLDSTESFVCPLFVLVAYLMGDLYITVFLWLDIRETNFGQKNQTLSRVFHKIMQYARPSIGLIFSKVFVCLSPAHDERRVMGGRWANKNLEYFWLDILVGQVGDG